MWSRRAVFQACLFIRLIEVIQISKNHWLYAQWVECSEKWREYCQTPYIGQRYRFWRNLILFCWLVRLGYKHLWSSSRCIRVWTWFLRLWAYFLHSRCINPFARLWNCRKICSSNENWIVLNRVENKCTWRWRSIKTFLWSCSLNTREKIRNI